MGGVEGRDREASQGLSEQMTNEKKPAMGDIFPGRGECKGKTPESSVVCLTGSKSSHAWLVLGGV